MLTKVWFQNDVSTNNFVPGHDHTIEQLLLEMLVFELFMLGQADNWGTESLLWMGFIPRVNQEEHREGLSRASQTVEEKGMWAQSLWGISDP